MMKAGAAPEKERDAQGKTCLHIAAENSQLESCKFIVEELGMSILELDSSGQNVFDLVKTEADFSTPENRKVVKYLRDMLVSQGPSLEMPNTKVESLHMLTKEITATCEMLKRYHKQSGRYDLQISLISPNLWGLVACYAEDPIRKAIKRVDKLLSDWYLARPGVQLPKPGVLTEATKQSLMGESKARLWCPSYYFMPAIDTDAPDAWELSMDEEANRLCYHKKNQPAGSCGSCLAMAKGRLAALRNGNVIHSAGETISGYGGLVAWPYNGKIVTGLVF
jgi:hypothetical protein